MKSLCTLAALGALFPIIAAADPLETANGFVSVSGGGLFTDLEEGESFEQATVNAEASLSVIVDDGVGIQFDLLGGSVFNGGAGGDMFASAAGHVFRRWDKGAVGVFAEGNVSDGTLEASSSAFLFGLDSANISQALTLGAEGVYFLGAANLEGSIEGTCASAIEDCQIGFSAGATYFATDDLSFNMTGRYDRLLFDPLEALPGLFAGSVDDVNRNAITGTAEVTYRIKDTPFSSSLGLGVLHFFGGDFGATKYAASASLTYHFGTKTLKEQSRTGPLFRKNGSEVLDAERIQFVEDAGSLRDRVGRFF